MFGRKSYSSQYRNLALIRRREGFWFLNLHFLLTTDWFSFSRFCTECLCPTNRASIPLSKLTHSTYLPNAAKKSVCASQLTESNEIDCSLPVKAFNFYKLLLQLHRLTAAMKNSIPAFGHNKFCSTFLTNISLPNLICHLTILPPKTWANLLTISDSCLSGSIVQNSNYQIPDSK